MKAFMQYFVGAAVPSVTHNLLTGKGASRGQVRGRARVVRQLKDGAALERGDILVCQTTSPPWTPLFAIAGGIVTDTGGILSHSAICAREYGFPCVVATQVATAMIPDGATIIVDGTAGTVTIETPA
jgi:pyruvate,water dikinase